MNILTPFGYKDISEVNIGDKVIGKNGVENILLGKSCLDHKCYKEGDSLQDYKYFSVNGKKYFGNQSIYCNGNVTHIYLLKNGDVIYNESGQEEKIFSFIEEKIDSNEGWWRLEVSGDHSYISDNIVLHNASRFLVSGGDGNWNNNNNWSATSGGASGASFPTSADDVTFDTNSANAPITTNVTAVVKSLTCSGTYAGTLTLNNPLRQTGSATGVTLVAGMTVDGSSVLVMDTTSTLNTNGVTIPALNLRGTATFTLSGDVTLSGSLVTNNTTATSTVTINGFKIYVGTTLNLQMTTGACMGTTEIVMNGTGDITQSSATSGTLRNNLTFNTAGTITFTTNLIYQDGTITYTAGTVDTATNSKGLIIRTAATLATNGMTWNFIYTNTATTTITLSNDCQCITLSPGASNTTVTINGNTIECDTLDSDSATSNTFAGSSNITVTGGSVLGTNIIINKTNNITFAGAITWDVTTFTYTSAGSITTTGSTLIMSGNRTFVGAVTWNNWTTSGTGTLTTNALQTLAGTLTVGDGFTTTFAGSNGVLSCANLTLGASSTLVIPTNATVTSTTTINASGSVINGAFTLNTGGLTMNGNLTGTLSLINFNATGTWSGIGVVIHNTTVNTAGTLTISGTVHYKTGTFTYTAGTVTVTGSTLSIDGSCTFEGALTWNNWTVAVTSTITINALQTLSGALTLQVATTFDGTTGWTANFFICTTAGLTHTFKQAITYTVTGTMAMVGTPKNKIKFISASTPTKAILTFTNPQTVYYVSPTDIDSSAGNPVLTLGGTITNTLNWNQILHPAIVTISG